MENSNYLRNSPLQVIDEKYWGGIDPITPGSNKGSFILIFKAPYNIYKPIVK